MSFTCPICERTSYNPKDVEYQYCGHCHTFPEQRPLTMMETHISKGPMDPICARVSCGGGERLGGYYVVYRGTVDESIAALEAALKAMRVVKSTGTEPPVDNKFKQLGAQ